MQLENTLQPSPLLIKKKPTGEPLGYVGLDDDAEHGEVRGSVLEQRLGRLRVGGVERNRGT